METLISSAELKALRKSRDGHFSVSNLKDYRDYYKGNQYSTLTEKQKLILQNLMKHPICDNVCFQVIKEGGGRLNFKGWHTTDKTDEATKFLAKVFRTSNIRQNFIEVRDYMLRDGNSVLTVDFEPDTNSIYCYVEEWYSDGEGSFIFYDDLTGQPSIALKEWSEKSEEGSNTYYCLVRTANYIYRFHSNDRETWVPYVLEGDKTESDGVSIIWAPGILNCIHFANGADIDQGYGYSEIFRIIGLQDTLNDKIMAISAATRFSAYQMYWGTGVKAPEISENNTGYAQGTKEASIFDPYPGNMLTSPSDKAKFGVFPAGSITSLIESYMLSLKRIAQVARVPLHSITGGDWPSGDALVRAELPAVNKAEDHLVFVTSALTSVAHAAIRINNTFLDSVVKEDVLEAEINVQMGDPERRDLIALSSSLVNLTGYISPQEGLRMLGKSQLEIDQIMREKKEYAEAVAEMAPKPVEKPVGGRVKEVEKKTVAEA